MLLFGEMIVGSRRLVSCLGRPQWTHRGKMGVSQVGSRRMSTDKPGDMLGGMSETELKRKITPLVPKAFSDLVKVDLFKDKSVEDIETIWAGYHDSKTTITGAVLSGREWAKMSKRIKDCPIFVYPVRKPNNAFFVLYSEWAENRCIMTYLEDYQRNPHAAIPYLYIVAYTELLKEKDIVLVHSEFLPYVTKEEASGLLKDSLDFYLLDDEKYKHVETFNHRGNAFDFQKVFNLP